MKGKSGPSPGLKKRGRTSQPTASEETVHNPPHTTASDEEGQEIKVLDQIAEGGQSSKIWSTLKRSVGVGDGVSDVFAVDNNNDNKANKANKAKIARENKKARSQTVRAGGGGGGGGGYLANTGAPKFGTTAFNQFHPLNLQPFHDSDRKLVKAGGRSLPHNQSHAPQLRQLFQRRLSPPTNS